MAGASEKYASPMNASRGRLRLPRRSPFTFTSIPSLLGAPPTLGFLSPQIEHGDLTLSSLIDLPSLGETVGVGEPRSRRDGSAPRAGLRRRRRRPPAVRPLRPRRFARLGSVCAGARSRVSCH